LDEIGFAWKPDGDHNFKQDDKLWHQQYEKVIEFKRTNGHCMVPFKYEQDKFLGKWVSHQRSIHKNNKIRPDRKDVLDKIGFVWKHVTLAARASTTWQKHYEKLVEFKQKKGHCMVPKRYEADKSLGRWVGTQRTDHKNNKMRPDRKRILDEIGFAWNQAITDPARSSTTNVRNLGIGSFHALGSRSCFSLSFFFPFICVQQTDSEASPHEELEETTEPAQGHVRNRSEFSTPNRKRPRRSCRVDSRQMAAARTNQGGKATGSCSSIEEDGDGREEEDSKPSLVTSNAQIGSSICDSVEDDGGGRDEDEEDSKPSPVNRSEFSSPNRKRPRRSCRVDSGQMAAVRTNRGGKATGSCSSIEEDGGGHDEEDSKPSAVTSNAPILGSDPEQEVVQEEAITHREIPLGWIRVKLEPDC
jgi:hypothetical protein